MAPARSTSSVISTAPRFRADNQLGPYTPPAGDLYQGFEGQTFGDWTTTGTAFGDGPATGNVPPQSGVSGFIGTGLANSFHGGDAAKGTLTSPTFTITRPYLNFLAGGGTHPHDPTTVDAPPPTGTVFADFEGDTYGAGWTATGTFAGTRPPSGTIGDQQPVSGYEGTQLVNTFIDHDTGTGTISSPNFTITTDYINFLIGGGNHPNPGSTTNPPTAVNLVVNGTVVRTATGQRQRGAQLDQLERLRARRADRPASRSSTRTPAAGGTSWPTRSPSPTSRRSPAPSRRASTCSLTTRSCAPQPAQTASSWTGPHGTSRT